MVGTTPTERPRHALQAALVATYETMATTQQSLLELAVDDWDADEVARGRHDVVAMAEFIGGIEQDITAP